MGNVSEPWNYVTSYTEMQQKKSDDDDSESNCNSNVYRGEKECRKK